MKENAEAGVLICFDPAVSETFRRSLSNAIHRLIEAVEMRAVLDAISTTLAAAGSAGGLPGSMFQPFAPDTKMDVNSAQHWQPGTLIKTDEILAGKSLHDEMPTVTQQNVPAWALYAMFMIVIPLSGVLIQEREHGTLVRLRILPVSGWTILLGKIIAYVVVCIVQFGLMLLIGIYCLSPFGTPALEMGNNYLAVWATVLASALCATGFGILVGVLAKTHNQAAVFGSTFVVIAAALGGIMVPVFLMPRGMRAISFLSPLNWGHSAFMDLFLRGSSFAQIAPDLAKLLLFFLVSLSLAALVFMKKS
jgi:ABC-2 type transport system permease protein